MFWSYFLAVAVRADFWWVYIGPGALAVMLVFPPIRSWARRHKWGYVAAFVTLFLILIQLSSFLVFIDLELEHEDVAQKLAEYEDGLKKLELAQRLPNIVMSAGPVLNIRNGKTVEAHVFAKNPGGTEATITSWEWSMVVTDLEGLDAAMQQEHEPEPGPIPLSSGGEISKFRYRFGGLSAQELEDVLTRSRYLVLIGTITYENILEEQTTKPFCFMYAGNRMYIGNANVYPGEEGKPCPKYN